MFGRPGMGKNESVEARRQPAIVRCSLAEGNIAGLQNAVSPIYKKNLTLMTSRMAVDMYIAEMCV